MENKKYQFCINCGRKKNLTTNLYCTREACKKVDPVAIKSRRRWEKKYQMSKSYRAALARYRASDKWKKIYEQQRIKANLGIRKPRKPKTRKTEPLANYLNSRLLNDQYELTVLVKKQNRFLNIENKTLEKLIYYYDKLSRLRRENG